MQACPYDHKAYTTSLLGAILPHDDSVNDRSPGSRLCDAEAATRCLWKKHLGPEASFSKPGAMFRGLPPQGRLFHIKPLLQDSVLTATVCLLDLTGMRYSSEKGLKPDSHAYALRVFATRKDLAQNLKREQKMSLAVDAKPVPQGQGEQAALEFADSDRLVGFPEGCDGEIEFRVVRRKRTTAKRTLLGRLATLAAAGGSGPKESVKCVGESREKLKVTEDFLGTAGGEITLEHRLWGGRSEGHGVLRATASLSRVSKRGVCRRLSILPGSYYDCVMPVSAESMWGPVPLPVAAVAGQEENACKAVTHGVLDAWGKKLFSVYLIHCLALEMSVIQLFVGDKMAVVAHLVGEDTMGRLGDDKVREFQCKQKPRERSTMRWFSPGFRSSTENHGGPC